MSLRICSRDIAITSFQISGIKGKRASEMVARLRCFAASARQPSRVVRSQACRAEARRRRAKAGGEGRNRTYPPTQSVGATILKTVTTTRHVSLSVTD